ncbi:MAG: hypothetical protein M9948_09465 [Lentimicrobium sp.]|nr:hypothetical protein [Lentimicrobium sp.]
MLAFNDKMAGTYTTPDDVLLRSAHSAALPFGQGVTSGFYIIPAFVYRLFLSGLI